MTLHRDRNDMIDRSDSAAPIEKAEAKDPIEPMERAEPTEPMDRTDWREPIESNESSDQSDHLDVPDRTAAIYSSRSTSTR
jgi:hypothetical protein